MHDYVKKILTARVYDVAIESPLDPMPRLSKRIGGPVLLKREDLQPVFSFKLRGAYNKMSQLDRQQLDRGVICASAGNHAQGVALAAAKLDVKAKIVMPQTHPHQGAGGGAAGRRGRPARRQLRRCFGPCPPAGGGAWPDIHPPLRRPRRDRRPGNGRDGDPAPAPGPDRSDFVPIGGGGLAAGIAVYVKFLRPDVKVIGVEPDERPACTRRWRPASG